MVACKDKSSIKPAVSFKEPNDTACYSVLTGLSDKELAQLRKNSTRSTHEPKELLFRQGSAPAGVYCVLSGMVKLSHSDRSGKETILDVVCPGGLIGFPQLFISERFQFSAVVIAPSEISFQEKGQFLAVLDRSPQLSKNVMNFLAVEVSDRTNTLVKYLQNSVRERVADVLLKFYEKHPFPLNMRREDLAAWAATSTESAVRCLTKLKREGIIRTAGREINILKPEELGRIAGRR